MTLEPGMLISYSMPFDTGPPQQLVLLLIEQMAVRRPQPPDGTEATVWRCQTVAHPDSTPEHMCDDWCATSCIIHGLLVKHARVRLFERGDRPWHARP